MTEPPGPRLDDRAPYDLRHVRDALAARPARCLAERYGCRVTAVEVRPELHESSTEPTALCWLSEHVTAVRADALTLRGEPWSQRYDHLVPLLTIRHIPRRPELFDVPHGLPRPGGTFSLRRRPGRARRAADRRGPDRGPSRTPRPRGVHRVRGDRRTGLPTGLGEAGDGPCARPDPDGRP
ncbi:hypothetical protein U5640_30935 [Streptomyces sp. SS7]|uniref:SAM-dependent methyltransferase n=1 Tax=Streptomyces sp. SS7 TaxID=3108485 RepID=UPI0030EEFDE9